MGKVAKRVVSLSAVLVLYWSGASAAQSAADEGAKRGFNPQPEPPAARRRVKISPKAAPAVPVAPVNNRVMAPAVKAR